MMLRSHVRVVTRFQASLRLHSQISRQTIFERDNEGTSVSQATICMRFLVILDPSYNWKSLVANQTHPLSHPHSNHLMTKLISEYNKRPYNYNDAGEFELIMAPAAYYPLSGTSKSLDFEHPQVLLYPDNLMIALDKLLFPLSVPTLYEKTMKSFRLNIDDISDSFQMIPQGKGKVSSLQKNKKVILVNISAEHPWSRAEKTIYWIEQSLMNHSSGNMKDFQVLITRDIVNMQVVGKWEIMFLPSGDRAQNLLSAQEVDRFIAKSISGH